MSDLLTESKLTLSQAARLFPGARGNSVVNPSTIFRWCVKGTKTADGRLVKLESIRAGSRLLTSEEAIRRYVSALSGTTDAMPAPRSPAAARRASERANKQLQEMGC